MDGRRRFDLEAAVNTLRQMAQIIEAAPLAFLRDVIGFCAFLASLVALTLIGGALL